MNLDLPPGPDGRRRRSPLACDTCRERRTKCDGQRPKCSFCLARSKDCFYQGPQDPPPSPLKVELTRIWTQIERITVAVQGRSLPYLQLQSAPLSGTAQRYQSPSGRDESLDFPFMILQSEAFMDLLRLDPSLSVQLEQWERRKEMVSVDSSNVPIVMDDLHRASELLKAFAEHIHIWYPILHADYTDEFIQAVTLFFPFSVQSCLSLLVLAIGCVVECDSIAQALWTRPERRYIQAAMEMLPCVLEDSTHRSAQCLLLFAIYHLCCAQPCQAHDFVAMASYKLQNSMMNDFDAESDPMQLSILGNCFWSALLIESELHVQLDLVDSGIWNMSSFAPAPTALETWTWAWGHSHDTTVHGNEHIHLYTPPAGSDPSYFMAEIAMRKMLQRCTWSFRTLSPGNHVYAPIMAAELERQLEEWRQLLPESLRFGIGSGRNSVSAPGSGSAQVAFLRTQYFAFKASIYWSAVYEAIAAGSASAELLAHCRTFFDAYGEFAASAVATASVCKPNTWTLYTSIFTISMAALTALAEPCLLEVVPLSVAQGLELTVDAFNRITDVSPSLAKMGEILRERTLSLHGASAFS
ncbi:uncharacterized protein BJX67DRAFT_375235 [Aspergillus lucknowensis]|uniref:Zn(2)-C6 fungal-type domain-containing protein n=1 Tax=Aspergillus lucknowensis TaxID=176173 RepID=A0ABR4LD06_9EURO